MSTNLFSETASAPAVGTQPRGLITALGATVLFAVRKYLKRKAVGKPELVSRAEFCAEMLATRERLHTNHLTILEKLDANHRELLAALERLGTRISALESGLARVDERTRN
jgi:predicted RNase H-like nuclease (RuvC/YqgF family)